MPAKHKYSDYELEFIVNNYKKLGRTKCAQILGIHKNTLFYQAKRMHIARTDTKCDNIKSNFILENYSKFGKEYCSQHTGLTQNQIHDFVTEKHLHLDKNTLRHIRSKACSRKKYFINMNLFSNIRTPEIAYLLGILWADGHISKVTNSVSLTLIEKDMKEIRNIINISGNWGMYNYKTRLSNNTFINISLADITFHDYLVDSDYQIKSGASADKILSKIPDHLKHYWWRGYIDGDGCFAKSHDFSIASVLNQDWSFYKNLCNKLGIRYKIKFRNRYKSTASYAVLSSKTDIYIIGKYIYQNYENDHIGFNRKYLNYMNTVDSIKIKRIRKLFHVPLPHIMNSQ